MPAVQLAPLPKQRFTDGAGNPLVGGKIFTYQAGTTTKQSTYTDASGATSNANPTILDSRGEAAIWFDQSLAYKVVLAPSTDTDPPSSPIWTIDNIPVSIFGQIASAAVGKGSKLVSFIQRMTGAAARLVEDKLTESVSVDDFGAVGNGVTDDSGAIILAQNALVSKGGGRLSFTYGKTYRVGTPIPMKAGITYQGTGRGDINNVAVTPGAKIVSSSTDIFVNAASATTGAHFSDLWLESLVGGGHVFNWSSAGLVAKIEMSGMVLVQNNTAKAIVQGTSGGGVFSIWLHDFEYKYAAGNAVPPMNFVSPTVNSVVIEKFWSTCSTGASSGTYSIWIESTTAGSFGIHCLVRQGVFELPGGGSVNLLSCSNSGIEQCVVYDLAVTPNNPQFRIAKGVTGPPSASCWVRGSRSTVGTAAKPDLQLDMSVSAQAGFEVEQSTFKWVDGVSTTQGPGAIVKACSVTNYINMAYVSMGGSATVDLGFNNTLATSKSYSIWNGYSGNGDGYLNIEQNSAYVGAVSPSRLFQWGGTRVAPAFYIQQNGRVNSTAQIYPGTGAGTDQGAIGLLAGTGAPSSINGNNGDIYFRSDGGSGTTIYQRRAGAWVGIV
jgi:hypothetical protein